MSVQAAQRVPFNDLGLQWQIVKDELTPELLALFEKSTFCLGPAVESFERNFAEFVGVKHAIGVNSGTSALHLAMLAAGIGPGDKVLLPAHTFIATAWGVVYAGAEPVFCDVDMPTGTIDVEDAQRRMSPGVKAIIPVHLYGQPADLRSVVDFANRNGIALIEDVAQAHGAMYDGKMAGSRGRFSCFSFYPGKNLGAAGEAGAVCTDDDAAATRMRALRNHGQGARYVHDEIGFNYRMEGIQGLVLDHKLRRLPEWTKQRQRIATRYLEAFRGLPLGLPEVVNQDHVYHLFVVRTAKRDALRTFLAEHEIETGLHYPVPLHRQPCFAGLAMDRESFPAADAYANECLSLPLYAGMTESQVDRVIEKVQDFLRTR